MFTLFLLLSIYLALIVHELGHYLSCKLFRVSVPQFIIGCGPSLLDFKKWGTHFSFYLIPLGGGITNDPNELNRISLFKEYLITLAGVVFNFIIGAIALISYLGEKTSVVIAELIKLIPELVSIFTDLSNSFGTENTLTNLLSNPPSSSSNTSFLLIFASVNIGLFFFNLLPIPVLDGGQLIMIPIRRWASKSEKSAQIFDNVTYVLYTCCFIVLFSPLLINPLLNYMSLAQSIVLLLIIGLVLFLVNKVKRKKIS